MSSLLKNLCIALGIVLMMGAAYFFFLRKPAEDLAAGADATELSTEISQKTAKILADTQKINTYDLDESIFTDWRFTSLKDLTITIEDVDTGRENPFIQVE